MVFAVVVSEIPVSSWVNLGLIVAALCAIGFLVSAFGAFTTNPVFSVIALAGAVGFLPIALYFFLWQGTAAATWRLRSSHAESYVVALVSDLVVAAWSGIRVLRSRKQKTE